MSQMKQQIEGSVGLLQKAIKKVKDVTPEAIVKAMRPIMELSQEYVPYLSGDLYNSAFLEIRSTATGPLVVFGYARNGFPHYAAIVHERTWVKHAGARASGSKAKRAKFLESAINERWHVFLAILEEETMKPIGSAGQVR